jgi:glycosyltransferase involved in cell wall biosynthesis
MAEARAVVGSKIGGVPEMIDDGVTGLLVEPDDIGSLARALDIVLRDRSTAARMGVAGLRSVRARFSNERLSSEWLRLLSTELGSIHANS